MKKEEITGYKGFDKNFQCRGMQYAANKKFSEDVKPDVCFKGLHFCQSPLDVFNYYPPTDGAIYTKVIATGNVKTEGDKSATNELAVGNKLTIHDLFAEHHKMVLEGADATTGNEAHAATTGDEAHAATTGRLACAATTGYRACAATTGRLAHAATSGDYAYAATSGKHSIACGLGVYSRVKATHGIIILVDWEDIHGEWVPMKVYSAKVGEELFGVKIQSDVWYWFKNGKLQFEVDSDKEQQ